MILDARTVDVIKYFNIVAFRLMTSNFKSEFKKDLDKMIKLDETSVLSYNNRIIDNDFVNSVLTPMGFLFKTSDVGTVFSANIENMNNLYNTLQILETHKLSFQIILRELNEFLDQPAETTLDSVISKRELLSTILYGERPYYDKQVQTKLELWKSNTVAWNYLYLTFQKIISDVIPIIEKMVVLNDYLITHYKQTQ